MKSTSGSLRGWTVSLLLHAIALAWLVRQAPPVHSDDKEAPHGTLVFVTVPPPKLKAAPEPAPAPAPVAVAAPARKAATRRPKPEPAQETALVPTAPAPIVTDSTAPAAAAAASADAPAFDVEAARTAARAIAKEEGAGARGGAALKETKDEQLGRAIEKSRRRDCKTRYAGMGVLAIIPLVRDTVTDTGCKW